MENNRDFRNKHTHMVSLFFNIVKKVFNSERTVLSTNGAGAIIYSHAKSNSLNLYLTQYVKSTQSVIQNYYSYLKL